MAKKFWWPNKLADQALLLANFKSKIGLFKNDLDISDEDLQEIMKICESVIAVHEYSKGLQSYTKQIFAWRRSLFHGESIGMPMESPATMPNFPDMEFLEGSLTKFFRFRERILTAKGYEESIGCDLGLYGSEKQRLKEEELAPQIKVDFHEDGKVKIRGSLRGLPAMQIEYSPNGGVFQPAAFITETPAEIKIRPQIPGQAEKGSIRAIFFDKNKPVGEYSPQFNISVY